MFRNESSPHSIILCVISAKYSCVIDSFFPLAALLWGDSFMHISGIFNHTENHSYAAKKVYTMIHRRAVWEMSAVLKHFHTRSKSPNRGKYNMLSRGKMVLFYSLPKKIVLTASHISLVYFIFIPPSLSLFIWVFAQNRLHFPSNVKMPCDSTFITTMNVF